MSNHQNVVMLNDVRAARQAMRPEYMYYYGALRGTRIETAICVNKYNYVVARANRPLGSQEPFGNWMDCEAPYRDLQFIMNHMRECVPLPKHEQRYEPCKSAS